MAAVLGMGHSVYSSPVWMTTRYRHDGSVLHVPLPVTSYPAAGPWMPPTRLCIEAKDEASSICILSMRRMCYPEIVLRCGQVDRKDEHSSRCAGE